MSDHDREQRERLLGAVLALATAQNAVGRQFARSQQLHTTDAAALVEILTAEGRGRVLTPARLAERVALTTGATSTLLNRLEDAGHISRRREHTDRRVVSLHITATSHELADAFYAPLGDQLDAVMQTFSDDDLATVEDLVDRLTSTMHAYADREDQHAIDPHPPTDRPG